MGAGGREGVQPKPCVRMSPNPISASGRSEMQHLPPRLTYTPPLCPSKEQTQIVRCRVKNGGSKISLQDVHATAIWVGGGGAEHWPSNVACRAARGPSQRANAGQYMRGGSGGRSVCKSHMLSPCKAAIEVDRDREKGGVMLMSQLMEISCQDCVGLRSRRSWRIRLKLQWWHRSFRPCLQKRCSI